MIVFIFAVSKGSLECLPSVELRVDVTSVISAIILQQYLPFFVNWIKNHHISMESSFYKRASSQFLKDKNEYSGSLLK